MSVSIGQHVTIGPDNGRKVSWQVASIHQADGTHTYATVKSGLAGVFRVVPIERLHPWERKPVPR